MIFPRCTTIAIHAKSNELFFAAVKNCVKTYKKLLDEYMPQAVFVCSYERHYALLCLEARTRGIQVNLFEEGSGSLKELVPGYRSFADMNMRQVFLSVIKRHWSRDRLPHISKKTTNLSKNIFSDVNRIGRSTAFSIFDLYNYSLCRTSRFKRKYAPFIEGWRQFDRVYSSTPELARRIFRSEEFISSPVRFDDPELITKAKHLAQLYNIGERTAIFTSQRYPFPPDAFAHAIVSTLLEVMSQNGWDIVIKLHPKERLGMIRSYKAATKKNGCSNRIQIIEEEHIPAEYLLIYSASPAVIAITSSTLIYAPTLKPTLRSISIGGEVHSNLMRLNLSSALLQRIDQDRRILDHIPYIEHYKNIVPKGAAEEANRARGAMIDSVHTGAGFQASLYATEKRCLGESDHRSK